MRVFGLSEKFEVLSMRTYPTPGLVNRAISLTSDVAGAYLLACNTGLYRFDAATGPILLKSGSFVDVAELPCIKKESLKLVAVNSKGAIDCFSMTPAQRQIER